MNHEYPPSEWLPLSGIQHFVFCRRQWALIQIEQQWAENALTAEGRILHKRADDPFFTEKRGDVIIARSVPVSSPTLGLTGICDVVEFSAMSPSPPGRGAGGDGGVQLPGREGFWQPVPVEYKRGRKKHGPEDEAQLCAQAMCLEEMLLVKIPRGFIFYAQTRRREPVEFSPELRQIVRQSAEEMHRYVHRGYTPKVRPSKACRSCSLADLCLPNLQNRRKPASQYVREWIEEMTG